MKTKIYTISILVFLIIGNTYAQKGDMILSFSGKDATTNEPVALDSVYIENLSENCDTTVYGNPPYLFLTWPSGISDNFNKKNNTFYLEPNYPNPFSGSTKFKIHITTKENLTIILYDVYGAIISESEKELNIGIHTFEIGTAKDNLYFLSVSNGIITKTIKLVSKTIENKSSQGIKYLGFENDRGYKSANDILSFVFQPGDHLLLKANAVGYYENTLYDNPIENTNYIFELQPDITISLPTVTTMAISDITQNSATSGGNVSDDGGATVTARGVCWGTNPNPTISDYFTTDGSGIGSFDSYLTGLSENTTYYIRAYATNSIGTGYGTQISFETLENINIYTEIHEYFDDIIDEEDIDLPDWKNIAETGTRLWKGSMYDNNKYAEVTSYNCNDDENIIWLITPLIDFDINDNEILTFNSAQAYWVHSPASVWFVQNLNGNDITNADKTQLTCTLADQNTPDHQWVNSGIVDLSDFSGLGRVAFRYEGSDPDGLTTLFRFDDIEIYPSESGCSGISTVSDIDGNTYNTVQIGDQCWMKENLKTTTYRNGTPIPNVTDDGAWENLSTGAYVWYHNDISWKDLYGGLYNWFATVDANGLCPTGWHVPTDDEWTALTDFIGGTGYGNELKSCRQVNSPLGGDCNTSVHPRWAEDISWGNYGTDDYGFSGLPGGWRSFNGDWYFYDGSFGFWWSSTEYSSIKALYRRLSNEAWFVAEGNYGKRLGFSVRCLRD